MAIRQYGFKLGQRGTGRVMRGPVIVRSFCTSDMATQNDGSATKLEIFPTPCRTILRAVEIVDGVEINNRNAVKRNKLHWICWHVIERFPNRKFRGLHKCLETLNKRTEVDDSQFSVIMQYIQKVVRFGGSYEEYILSLFSIWDGAATISDAAADIGIKPSQWTQVVTIQGQIRKLNQAHNEVLNSERFRRLSTRVEREAIVSKHAKAIEDIKPLLLKLMTLKASNINPEYNADLDDFIEENEVGKRLARRIKRGYFNALARECLRSMEGDPLKIFGKEADSILHNMAKVKFSSIGEIKIGNKIHRINVDDVVVTDADEM